MIIIFISSWATKCCSGTYKNNYQLCCGIKVVANRMNDEFIKKAVECVRANIANENFGKEEFASALALSQSLLYKKIKALTNLSVVEFIRSIRLNYAMEKLCSGEYNVTEVSEMCGFNTSAYFSKVFKEYFGKTPTEVMQNSAL